MSPDEPALAPDGPAIELKEVVGDELTRLPDDYRRPIVLCYLDGLTHQEAARRLDWPVGTVKVRLVRGRRMLRERLHRRGVALGAGLLVMLSPGRRASALTEPLVESTVRAMSLVRGGPARLGASGIPTRLRAGRCGAGDRDGPEIPVALGRAVARGASLALSVPVAQALGGPPVSEVDPSTLPRNLTDVLKVECR